MRLRPLVLPFVVLLVFGCASTQPPKSSECDNCPNPGWANCTGREGDPKPGCSTQPIGPEKPGCNESGPRACEDGRPPIAGPSPVSCTSYNTPCGLGPYEDGKVQFAVIGDWGDFCCQPSCSRFVPEMIESWNQRWPLEFILTTGDNFYPDGSKEPLETAMAHYQWIDPQANRFFPSLGNHDLYDGCCAKPYLTYFSHLGSSSSHNARYYKYTWRSAGMDLIDLFALNADNSEPDGNTSDSKQAQWLQRELANSGAKWKIVYFHEPPYSSHPGGISTAMRWPFKEWGASIVLNGHVHAYERLVLDGLTYVVNGVGGVKGFDHIHESEGCTAAEGSLVRYNGSVGAMIGVATEKELRFCLLAVDRDHPDGVCIDNFSLTRN